MKKNTSKAPIIPVVLSFAIFALTLLLTSRYVSRSAMEEAELHNRQVVESVSNIIDEECLVTERAVRSFLSAWFCYPEGDSVNLKQSPMYIKDSELQNFRRDLYSKLQEFIKANNKRFISVHFIINPGIFPESGSNYFVPYVSNDGFYVFDGATKYDINSLDGVETFMTMTEDGWIAHAKDSPLQGLTQSYYMPLLREDGSRFGVFAVNMSLQNLQAFLRKVLPYPGGMSEINIEDEDGNLFNTSNSYTGGDDCYVFRHHLQQIPYDVVVKCSSKAIYSRADQTILVVLLVALVAIVLMLVCTIVVYRRVMRQEREMIAAESELRLAADVQTQLLKAPAVSGPGFDLTAWLKPALEAGGDLYDYVRKPSGVLFIVGDVSGKGMPAALFMGQVCSLFRSASSFSDDPAYIVSRLNTILSDGNASSTFCTLIVGFLCTNGSGADAGCRMWNGCTVPGRLLLCNAGHNLPVLLHDGKPQFLNLKRNIPVAVDADVRYENESVDLSAGDTVLLYTDGVTEARSLSGELYGNARLLSSVAADGLATLDPLVSDLRTYASGAIQSDDITLLRCTWLG